MTIEQRSANTWRVKQMYEGKYYSVSFDHKPSQREALTALSEAFKSGNVVVKGTFNSAANEYIEMKSNVLSPRTIREYKLQPARLPKWFQDMSMSSITQKDVQRCINELSKTMAPKTVRTIHGFIASVFGLSRPDFTLRTTLPKMQKKEPYIPQKEDLVAILKEAEGTQYHIPIQLACYGLRRGEICALEIDDLSPDNVIHIRYDLVQDSDGVWVKKPPKTPTSVRDVPIDSNLAEEIRQQGYIFNGFPGTISNFLARTQKKLGLETFSIHKLRHLFASILLDKGYDMKTIQDLGGWQGNETVSKVYLHSLKLKDELERKKIAESIGNFLG